MGEHVHEWVVDPDDPQPNHPDGYVYCAGCGEPKGPTAGEPHPAWCKCQRVCGGDQ